MKSISLLVFAGCALLLSACSSTSTPTRVTADRNGDGIIDARENVQYTRALEVAQAGRSNQNIADANGDGFIDDIEHQNWRQRQQILGQNEQSAGGLGGIGAAGGKVLDSAYQVLSIGRLFGGF